MTLTRSEYATAHEGDVATLRAAFEAGSALTKELAMFTYAIPERRFRAAVAALRAEGYPVVSFSEAGSTYRKAKDADEMERFIDTELVPRYRKIENEARAMRTRGRSYFQVTQGTLL